eukprot:5827902-Prymnesium_polylepis.1
MRHGSYMYITSCASGEFSTTGCGLYGERSMRALVSSPLCTDHSEVAFGGGTNATTPNPRAGQSDELTELAVGDLDVRRRPPAGAAQRRRARTTLEQAKMLATDRRVHVEHGAARQPPPTARRAAAEGEPGCDVFTNALITDAETQP